MGHTELTVIICEKCNCVSEDNEVFIPPDREVSYGCYGVISNQENYASADAVCTAVFRRGKTSGADSDDCGIRNPYKRR